MKIFSTWSVHWALVAVAVILGGASVRNAMAETPKFNFVIVFADDQGYGDLGCFGAPKIKTPHIDRMAREGMKFTSFYSQAVCGPARTALHTGCYPLRVAEFGNDKRKFPFIHTKEILLPKILQEAGYRTGWIGKVDITMRKNGWSEKVNPVRRGFDFWYGVVGANDGGIPKAVYRNETRLPKTVTMNELTTRYTEEALGFIRASKDEPFFLYVAHTMPHVKLGVSDKFRGKSEGGMYGDVIEEIDWSTGQIVNLLKELELDNNTIVVYTSDNGPWNNLMKKKLTDKQRQAPDMQAGSAGPLTGSKGSTWEGGIREPCVVWGPGFVPAAKVCDDVCSTMDLLPTFIELAGAKLPEDRIIDGKSISHLMSGKPDVEERVFYYYSYTHLHAVRQGQWKLVLPRIADADNPISGIKNGFTKESMPAVKTLHLFDLNNDIGEKTNVADAHPEVVARLQKLIDKAIEDLGDYHGPGKGVRFFEDGPKWKAIDGLRKLLEDKKKS